MNYSAVLRQHSVKDTKPRRLVLQALHAESKPLSPQALHDCLRKKAGEVNLVTIYRVLDKFTKVGLVHEQPSSGCYTLCSQLQQNGHHVLLSCTSCGCVYESINADLCAMENRIARTSGFVPQKHISEIVGVCSSCT